MPTRQGLALVLIFFGIFAVGYPVYIGAFGKGTDLLSFSSLHGMIVFFSGFMVYLVSFTAIEQSSPSLTIMLLVGRSGKIGLTEESIMRSLAGEDFIGKRLRELLNGGKLESVDGRLFLSQAGIRMLAFFTFYQRLLRVNIETG